MDVMEALKGRRSIRRYKGQPVSDDLLRDVLEAACQAPSWANTQCWKFIVVHDPETKQRLANTLKSLSPTRENRAAQALRDAPVVLVACAELGKAGFYYAGELKGTPATDKGDWFMFDVALALENLTLAAHALGLGTVHIGLFDAAKVADILGVPRGVAVVEIMPLGYPAEEPVAPSRKALSESVFRERYGQPWLPD